MEIENQGNGTAERLTPEERHERVKKLKRKSIFDSDTD